MTLFPNPSSVLPLTMDPEAPLDPSIDWRVTDELVPYADALAEMEARVAAIAAGDAPELIWLLQHPPLYTAGTSADDSDLIDPDRFPVFETGRGGQYTYHGPGQRVGYCLLDIRKRSTDVRNFVQRMEHWIISALAEFSLVGHIRDGRVGVWIAEPGQPEKKIAAIGLRIRKGISFHGFSINVEPDLSHFGGIVPCGLNAQDFGVTSLVDQGLPVTMDDLDVALKRTFTAAFPALEDATHKA